MGLLALRRAPLLVLLAATALLAVACGENRSADNHGEAASTPFVGVDTIADAEAAAREVVDATVVRFLPENVTRPDGLDRHPCDPLEDGQVLYDYVLAVDVPADEILGTTRDIWQYWQDEYGFELQSQHSSNEPPVVLAEVDGFRGSITGDPEKALIYIGVSSPCFPPEG